MDVYKINEACGNTEIPESQLYYVLQFLYDASRNTEYVKSVSLVVTSYCRIM